MEVVGLKIKENKGKIKSLNSLTIDSHGILDEVSKRDNDKQISMLSERVRSLIDDGQIDGLCVARFYENITIRNLEPEELSLGLKLQIGGTVQEIMSIGKRCFKECKLVKEGTRCELMHDVVFTKVIKGGTINLNDKVNSLD